MRRARGNPSLPGGSAPMTASSNRGEAFASDPAAVGQRGAAALAPVAVEKTVLPFPADF